MGQHLLVGHRHPQLGGDEREPIRYERGEHRPRQRLPRAVAFAALAGILWSLALSPTIAQAEFTTIINSPPTIIGDYAGIDSDTQLNVFDGGLVGNYFAPGNPDGSSTNVEVNVYGGSIGEEFDAYGGSRVNVSGGTIGRSFDTENGSIVNITGGAFSSLNACSGGVVNLSGASFSSDFDVRGGQLNIRSGEIIFQELEILDGSIVNVSGGTIVLAELEAKSGSVVNISGGTGGYAFDADARSILNMFGTQFVLDGVDITASHTQNVPFTITPRDVMLTGLLADGSAFDFYLASVDPGGDQDALDPSAMLTVTLGLPGDYNSNWAVDAADYTVWRDGLGTIYEEADYGVWKAHFGETVPGSGTASSAAVPEPVSSILLAIGGAAIIGAVVRRRW